MILNEQLIEDMFQDQPSRDPPSLPREDISLNFTSTSRSAKNHNHRLPSTDIVATAHAELDKFETWMQNECAALQSVELNALIEKIESQTDDAVQQEDLLIIKGELFRHQEASQPCPECPIAHARLQQLQVECEQHNRKVAQLEEAVLRQAVDEVREYLLGQVENNALRSEIRELHAEINALRNEKITLERTFLFNKTRNSDINLLQKSKDLSAAKNSTNSSELLGRNEAIVFIDPIESDVEEWIRFFEAQKNRYRLLSRKEAEERQRELGRLFSREEREHFEATDRLSLLLLSIREILTHLHRIRENTAAFEQTDLSRSGQRVREDAALREEMERLHLRLGKAVRLNESLLKEKRNLEQIGACLQQQRLKDSHERNALSELLRREALRVRELQEAGRQARLMLMEKEEELLYAFEEIKKLRREAAGEKQGDLEGRCRMLEKKHQEKLKEYEFQRNSYIFKLKKEALQRRRYCNELEESKGILRVYFRTPAHYDTFEPSPAIYKVISDSQQDKLYEDIRRLVIGALDGFSFSVFNYGNPDTAKAHFLSGDELNPSVVLRVLREIFRLIEAEKDLRVEPSLSICEVAADKVTDLIDSNLNQPDKQDGLSFASLPYFSLDSLEAAEQTLFDAVGRRRADKAHLVIRVSLDVHSHKTNDKYRSKITLVDLLEPEREQPANAKGLAALAKCLMAFSSREKLIPCRENRLTQALKDCFNPSSKIAVVVNVGGTNKEELRQAVSFAEACRAKKEESEENRTRKSLSRKHI